MRILNSATVCFCVWCLLQAFQACIPPLERFTEALRTDCMVAPSAPPKHLNGGRR